MTNPVDIMSLLDANIEVAERLGVKIEFISMSQQYAEYLSEEILRPLMDEEVVATFPAVKEYRNIPIRIVDNLTVKVCYAFV